MRIDLILQGVQLGFGLERGFGRCLGDAAGKVVEQLFGVDLFGGRTAPAQVFFGITMLRQRFEPQQKMTGAAVVQSGDADRRRQTQKDQEDRRDQQTLRVIEQQQDREKGDEKGRQHEKSDGFAFSDDFHSRSPSPGQE